MQYILILYHDKYLRASAPEEQGIRMCPAEQTKISILGTENPIDPTYRMVSLITMVERVTAARAQSVGRTKSTSNQHKEDEQDWDFHSFDY
jgi:hypothetical protein